MTASAVAPAPASATPAPAATAAPSGAPFARVRPASLRPVARRVYARCPSAWFQAQEISPATTSARTVPSGGSSRPASA
ncbi:hypothetical protein [Streptomyces tsukubensis]|uniref:hypothetical protein n=1 Tax=Streptomyces tsukubensis TaxID=83656 RepID=UPI00386ACB30